MESTAQHGCIQVSEVTYALFPNHLRGVLEPTGGIMVKVGGCACGDKRRRALVTHRRALLGCT